MRDRVGLGFEWVREGERGLEEVGGDGRRWRGWRRWERLGEVGGVEGVGGLTCRKIILKFPQHFSENRHKYIKHPQYCANVHDHVTVM